MKSQATDRLRVVVNDAGDTAARRCRKARSTISVASSRGPHRHHGRRRQYRDPQPDPVRPGAHPQSSHLLKEMTALEEPDRAEGLAQFDRRSGATSDTASPMRSAPGRLDRGLFAPAPDAGRERLHKQLGRYASAFALAVDMALLIPGGALKRHEMLSACRDILSELYLCPRCSSAGRTRTPTSRSALLAWHGIGQASRRA